MKVTVISPRLSDDRRRGVTSNYVRSAISAVTLGSKSSCRGTRAAKSSSVREIRYPSFLCSAANPPSSPSTICRTDISPMPIIRHFASGMGSSYRCFAICSGRHNGFGDGAASYYRSLSSGGPSPACDREWRYLRALCNRNSQIGRSGTTATFFMSVRLANERIFRVPWKWPVDWRESVVFVSSSSAGHRRALPRPLQKFLTIFVSYHAPRRRGRRSHVDLLLSQRRMFSVSFAVRIRRVCRRSRPWHAGARSSYRTSRP